MHRGLALCHKSWEEVFPVYLQQDAFFSQYLMRWYWYNSMDKNVTVLLMDLLTCDFHQSSVKRHRTWQAGKALFSLEQNLLKLVVIEQVFGEVEKSKTNNNIPLMESEIQNNSSFHSGHRRVSQPKAKTRTGEDCSGCYSRTVVWVWEEKSRAPE